MITRSVLDAAKHRLRIPDLWRLLGLPGNPGRSCRVPYREDRKASGSVWGAGARFHDFATGEDIDAIEFLARARRVTNGQAIQQFVELSNGHRFDPGQYRAGAKPKEQLRPILTTLRLGSCQELQLVATNRHLCLKAIQLAQDMGLLRFGSVCGFPSWIVTDLSGRCAEGRRLDQKTYPAIKDLPERKAHTIKNSSKRWPVGTLREVSYHRSYNIIALVEGGPDLLSIIHFALKQGRTGILPVAILGRAVSRQGLHPDSLQYFRRRRVRIYPHNDADKGSYENAVLLARELQQLGCEVDFFVFEGLRKTNGSPIKDLNECAELAPEHSADLNELFP